jgi:DNA-binding XRE family transcriptional regulator
MPKIKEGYEVYGRFLPERIRQARKEAMKSQIQVAKFCGVSSKQAVSFWENGFYQPRESKKIKLCKLFKKSPAYFFGTSQG